MRARLPKAFWDGGCPSWLVLLAMLAMLAMLLAMLPMLPTTLKMLSIDNERRE